MTLLKSYLTYVVQWDLNYLGMFAIMARMDNKVSKGAKIRNRYNQVPRLTQDTNRKVTNSQ